MRSADSDITAAKASQSLAGRVCPVDYQLPATAFAKGDNPNEPELDVLYLAGGLYGNPDALTQIERIISLDSQVRTRLVLNGDFHWFDANPEWFELMHRRCANHWQTRGNVETEMSRGGDTDAGCGCAYPDSVADEDVARSNQIMQQLGQTARTVLSETELTAIGALPSAMTVRIGDARIGITHGDDQSLAGWTFAQDQLDNAWASGLFERMARNNIDLFASSHTCLPIADTVTLAGAQRGVINNGSAGMANFAGTSFGVISRIARWEERPSPVLPLYEARVGQLRVSAVAVPFDLNSWLTRFQRCWPVGSAASESYLERIKHGPAFDLSQAACGEFELSKGKLASLKGTDGLGIAA